jgi:hypothetical protein
VRPLLQTSTPWHVLYSSAVVFSNGRTNFQSSWPFRVQEDDFLTPVLTGAIFCSGHPCLALNVYSSSLFTTVDWVKNKSSP